MAGWFRDPSLPTRIERIARLAERVADVRRAERQEVLRRTAAGEFAPDRALQRLDAMRYVDKMVYHVWRMLHHLVGPSREPGPRAGPASEVYEDAEGRVTD